MWSLRGIVIGSIALCVGIAFSGPSAHAGSSPRVDLQMGTAAQPSQMIGQALKRFVKYASTDSDGQVKIDLHGSSSICAELTCLRSIKDGSLDIGTAADASYASFTSRLNFIEMPYLWKDTASADKVLDGAFGREVREQIASEAHIKILAILDDGSWRELWTTTPVKVPADEVGRKVRSSPSPVELALHRAWGEEPVTLNWPAIYSALQQHLVSGELVELDWVDQFKHDEVLKYVEMVHPQMIFQVVSMTTERFNALPKGAQEALLKAGRQTEQWTHQANRAEVYHYRKLVVKHGVTIYYPTPSQMREWVAKSVTIWPQFSKSVPAKLISRILKDQGCAPTGCVPAAKAF